MDTSHTHIMRHHSNHGQWDAVSRKPIPTLGSYVLRYQGYRERTTSFLRRLEVPSGNITVIINFGPAFRVTGPRSPAGSISVRSSFVAGLHDAHALVESTGPQCCLQVDFTPIGAYSFLGVSMRALANQVVELDDLPGSILCHLAERLYEAPSWEARFSLLDSIIAKRLMAARTVSPDVDWVWGKLRDSDGRIQINRLVEELDCSHKHFIAQFREYIGLAPKMVARVLRFNHTVQFLGSNTHLSLTEIAYECGYSDQAHCIKDFRTFAGLTPGDFRRRLLPDGNGVIGG